MHAYTLWFRRKRFFGLILKCGWHNYYVGPPSPPSNVMAPATDYQPNNFSIIISWEAPEYGLVDEYRIETNTTTQTISTNTTKVVLEGEYNIPLEINISATNCAGSSAEVTEEICIGMLCTKNCYMFLPSLPLSWLFSSHSTCQWQCW